MQFALSMQEPLKYKAIVIGGSAGSFKVINNMLRDITEGGFPIPIVLCLHRLQTVRHGFAEALSYPSHIPVIEPDDKTNLKPNKVYLAPADYHLCIELGKYFSLSNEEKVNSSRPAIDLLFKKFKFVDNY